MSEAPQTPEFDVVDAPYKNTREGPRLDIFEKYLKAGGERELAIGKALDVPTITNSKGKQVPKYGFNVKLANITHYPKVFAKKRVRNDKNADVLRIFRLPDETEESAKKKAAAAAARKATAAAKKTVAASSTAPASAAKAPPKK